MVFAGAHVVLTLKERQFLGTTYQHKPAAGLVDGPSHTALQSACAV
uniref:Plasmid replication protein C n=1 Tax=Edwardsiella piscicida TaxID=1263550 RepID=A0A2H4NFQ6_EDWPI|nr:plasmid replication protein C [Edwardsiella piscicida]